MINDLSPGTWGCEVRSLESRCTCPAGDAGSLDRTCHVCGMHRRVAAAAGCSVRVACGARIFGGKEKESRIATTSAIPLHEPLEKGNRANRTTGVIKVLENLLRQKERSDLRAGEMSREAGKSEGETGRNPR